MATTPKTYKNEPIAVVGIGSLFPDAFNSDEFWQNIINKHNSIKEVPLNRWDPKLYYDPDKNVPDKTYTKIGAFIEGFDINPVEYRIPPKMLEQISLVHRYALYTAKQALEDANYKDKSFPNERTAVILGNSLGGEKVAESDIRIFFPKYLDAMRKSKAYQSLSPDERKDFEQKVESEFKSDLHEINEDSMPGELSNVIAGRIANFFNLRGKNMTSDAACASSLAAIDVAYKGLLSNEYDAAVVGGADRSMAPTTYVKFSKIGALSADGSFPFDERANGFVMGEGAGMMVLKRLSDAKKAGDKIYALIVGVGASSDGRGKGITAPNPKGQTLAVKRAYDSAGLKPTDVQLIEAHGTSTRVGDKVELDVLDTIFRDYGAQPQSVRIGSIKSQIGHLKSGAGAAGMLKAIMALHYKTYPPSINYEKGNPNIDWTKSPFVVNTEAIPWNGDDIRRAGVSSFGFGGTNFHVVLEEYRDDLDYQMESVAEPVAQVKPSHYTQLSWEEYRVRNKKLEQEPIILSAPNREQLILAISKLDDDFVKQTVVQSEQAPPLLAKTKTLAFNTEDPWRIGFTYKDHADFVAMKKLAIDAVNDPAKRTLAQARGIFISDGLQKGKTVFAFPGQGSQYADMMWDLARKYDIVEQTVQEADLILKDYFPKKLSDYIFSHGRDKKQVEEDLRQTQVTQPALLTVDIALFRLMTQFGIKPDMTAGHSLGEYAALVAAGVLSFKDALVAVAIRGKAMSEVDAEDKGTMASIAAPVDKVEEVLKEVEGYAIAANKNSLNSTVISGSTPGIEEAVGKFEEHGIKAIRLSVSAAFHTKIVEPAAQPLSEYLDTIKFNPPKIPITSNVTGDFFPEDPEEIRALMKKQVGAAVEWTQQVQNMYSRGGNVFFEIGPKRALSSFASNIVPEALAIICNHPKKGDIKSFNETLSAAAAVGFPLTRISSTSEILKSQMRWQHKLPTSVSPSSSNLSRLGINTDKIVVSGIGVGLPGKAKEVFDEQNLEKLFRGDNFIDQVDREALDGQLDKNIKRLIKKSTGTAEFFVPRTYDDVIKLAGVAGSFDLKDEFKLDEKIVSTFDETTSLAIGAGLLALRDAGIPLIKSYRKTSTGSFLPGDWELPRELQEDTGVIFGSAFPGYNTFADEMQRYNEYKYNNASKKVLNDLYAEISRKVTGPAQKELLSKVEHELAELDKKNQEYVFNRKILLEILSFGHAQFAQLIKAKGPNTQVNSACATTTLAVGIANDWIRTGRCKRVIIISADDVTSDKLFPWIGSGFLATGAATIKERVSEAALPFDNRREGMIVGMGAAALVIESAKEANRRGLNPIAEVIGTYISNSSFHGTRLDVNHVSSEMGKFLKNIEREHGLKPGDMARSMMFMSHETYTPKRGGSAAAEIQSLRDNFGSVANKIVIANTKGFTGHAMGAGIEDVVAIKALQLGQVPPIANFKIPDPDLGDLTLSMGGKKPVNYAFRLAAGFGSQIAFAVYKKIGGENRFTPGYSTWLKNIGSKQEDLYLEGKTLRVKDTGVPIKTAIIETQVKSTKKAPRRTTRKPAPRKPRPKPIAKPPVQTTATGLDSDMEKKIISTIAKHSGYSVDMVQNPTLSLSQDLGVESVTTSEIIADLRESYGITIPELPELEEVDSVNQIGEYLKKSLDFMEWATFKPEEPTPKSRPKPTPKVSKPVAKVVPKSTVSKKEMVKTITETIADKTGYSIEMIEPDLSLAEDLGIDSIKIAEIFGELREGYGLELDEDLDLEEVDTINSIADYFSGRMGAKPVETSEEWIPPQPVQSAIPTKITTSTVSIDEMIDTITSTVSEKTGYTIEMIEPDLSLAEDLGIDSIKIAEIFGELREGYGLELDEDLDLEEVDSIRSIAEYFAGRMSSETTVSTEEWVPPQPVQSTSKASIIATSTVSIDEMIDTITSTVSEKTGYTVDMIEPDLSLAEDLGIDSIKIAEIFGELREGYGLELDEDLDLEEVDSIRSIAEYFAGRIGTETTVSSEEWVPPQPVQPVYKSSQAPITSVSIDEMINTITSTVSEKTGYTVDMIEPDLSLAEDLGIDSIKIAEIFGELREGYGLELDEDLDLEEVDSIRSIAEYFAGRIGTETTEPAEEWVPPQPVQPTKPKTMVSSSINDMIDTITSTVSEKTGYTVDMIEPDLSLAEDLGIDSIKIAEIFGDLREGYGLELDEDLDLEEVDSIRSIAEYFAGRMGINETETTVEPVQPTMQSANRDEVLNNIIDEMVEQTGYPRDMLEDTSLSISESLGVDSIKMAEIFGSIRESYGLPFDENVDMEDLDTADAIADYFMKKVGSPAPSQPSDPQPRVVEPAPKGTIHRYVLKMDEVPAEKKKSSTHKGVIVGTSSKALTSLAGYLDLPTESNVNSLQLEKNSTVIFFNPNKKSIPTMNSLFTTIKENVDNIRHLVLVVKPNNKADMLPIHRLSALQGAVAGFIKAINMEFSNISAKIIVADSLEHVKGEINQEGVEVMYENNTRYLLSLHEENLRSLDWKLPEDAVLLASGGAQGITFEIIKEIASKNSTIILLGRTKMLDDAEKYTKMSDQQINAFKMDLMKELKAEGKKATPVEANKLWSKYEKAGGVWKAIQTLEQIGARVIYKSVDIQNSEMVDTTMQELHKELDAPITHFIHGAGIEISRPTPKKSVEEFDLVFDVKTLGFDNIINNLETDKLSRVIGFSSVAGRFGNATQVDYSAANDWLAKRCAELNREGVHASVIDWSAWDEIGMATKGSTMKVLEAQGVTPIPVKKGVQAFVSEFAGSNELEVVISGELGGLAAAANWHRSEYTKGVMIDEITHETKSSYRMLSLNKDKYLDDHRISEKAVLPGVMGMETMSQTFQVFTGHDLHAMQDVVFKSPVKLPKDNDLEIITFMTGFGQNADLNLKSKFIGPDGKQLGDLREHFEGTAIAGTRLPSFPTISPILLQKAKENSLMDQGGIYDEFFHGPRYQVLKSINQISRLEIIATFNRPDELMFDAPVELVLDPLAIEAAFQTAGMHLIKTKQQMGLPSAVGRVIFFDYQNKEVAYIRATYLSSTDTHSSYNVDVVDSDGNCLIRLDNYEMVHTGEISGKPLAIDTSHKLASVKSMAAELSSDLVSLETDHMNNVSYDFIQNFLTKSEQMEYNSVKVDKRKNELLSGRIAAKLAVSQKTLLPLNEIEVLRDENNSPYCIVNSQKIHISISHKDGIALAIAGDYAVDVEEVEKRKKSWVKQYFSKEEINEFSLENDREMLAKLWTIKEAHSKRMRVGLKNDLKRFKVNYKDNKSVVESPEGTSEVASKSNKKWVISLAK